MRFEDIPENDKWWAGGFADGDACVCIPFSESMQKPASLTISIGHALLGLKTLNKWQTLFGGKVSKAKEAEGNRQEIWDWQLGGKKAARLCKNLQSYSRLKREQFVLAAQYYDAALEPQHKLEIYSTLVALKRTEHTRIDNILPVAYFSGFFDAEGSVTLTAMGAVGCKIEQKYRAICDAAAKQFACGARSVSVPGSSNACFKWQVSSNNCRAFLTTIKPYMIEKLEMAEIILQSSKSTVEIDKARLALLVGNQGKSKKPRLARARKCASGRDLPVNISEVYIPNEAHQLHLSGYQYKQEGYKIKKIARKNASPEMLAEFLRDILAYKCDENKPVSQPFIEKKECLPYGISVRYHRRTHELRAYIVQLKRRNFSFSREFSIDRYRLDDLSRLVELMTKHADRATANAVKTSKEEVDTLLIEALKELAIF